MFYSDLISIAAKEFEKDFLSRTEESEEHRPFLTLKYPSDRQNRKINNQQRLARQAALTENMYHRIKSNSPLVPRRKRDFLEKISRLRPNVSTLKAFYRKRGESEETIRLLTSPQNYPHLPYVWITKKQYRFLVNLIKGKEDKSFIEKGFR